ncbi:hypothetical protein [Microbacterium arborescens]|uniref:hypothetical protein n=1 Tax=Microbacterium arborescens TaxID=33883 RepID=UPI0027814211|nr:hypothetical protein [Microbacterium arborescens]MDQ1216316.1 hypothetical protein [Microbacterium arborescens]
MNTVVQRRPEVAPARPAIPEQTALGRPTLAQRLIVWSANRGASSAPEVAYRREQLAARESRERHWERAYLLTPYR